MEYSIVSFIGFSPGVCFSYIITQGKPLQIFQAVVFSIGVPVVCCILAGFRCSQESKGYKPVNIPFLSVYINLLVAVSVVKWF